MDTYKARNNNQFKIAMVVVLILVLLASSILFGSVLAWLTDRDEFDDGDRIKIGAVDFDIYNEGTKITATKNNADGVSPEDLTTVTSQEIEVTGSTTIRDLKITIRNTGTVSAIMRATVTIKYLNDLGQKLPCLIADTEFTLDNQIDITNTGWIDDFSADGSVASGYTYYNSQINPYTVKSVNTAGAVISQEITANEVKILSQILVPDSMKNETYYISISVEGVAYSGNIYQEDADKDAEKDYEIPVSAYPFGSISNLPVAWTAWQKN